MKVANVNLDTDSVGRVLAISMILEDENGVVDPEFPFKSVATIRHEKYEFDHQKLVAVTLNGWLEKQCRESISFEYAQKQVAEWFFFAFLKESPVLKAGTSESDLAALSRFLPGYNFEVQHDVTGAETRSKWKPANGEKKKQNCPACGARHRNFDLVFMSPNRVRTEVSYRCSNRVRKQIISQWEANGGWFVCPTCKNKFNQE